MIIVDNLHKEFAKLGKPKFGIGKKTVEKVKAVDGVSFAAQDGAILGLLGANGAGKTTSLRMVASLLKADSGQIQIDDVVVKEGKTASQSRLGILSDARGLYPRLTSRENIHYYGKLHGMDKDLIAQRTEQLAHWLDTTHIMQEVERLCDTVVIVAKGKTVAKGSVPELMEQAQESDFEDAFVKLAFLEKQATNAGNGSH
ncbi:MAG: ATP-binding cassette domain-containing protein [Burkholderiales bacterium]|nr:ATP-binding cassette domain-containing protein [Burkholderiales bacterium]